MGGTWCDPLTANRYMLKRGSAWTGSRLASSGMPGWKKGALFVQRMVERSTVRLRQLACKRAEEVKLGRFLRNDRVSLEALNRGAGERVGQLAQGCRHVLAIQSLPRRRPGIPQSSIFSDMRGARGGWARSAMALTRACFCTRCWRSRRMADAASGWPGPSCGCGAARSRPDAASGQWRQRKPSAGKTGPLPPRRYWPAPNWLRWSATERPTFTRAGLF